MNGQYLMNKQVSVQYAYKKDGKGERHGDEAERMLAAQARKHNVRPPTQQVPPASIAGGGPAPVVTPAIPNGDSSRPVSTTPQTSELGMGRGMPPVGYQGIPVQPRPATNPPVLTTPPPGLPARPPPSQAGYGGPQAFLPPGFNGAGQQNFAPQSAPPPGFAPPGFGPPAGTPGAPAPLPPGFQQPGYGGGH